MSNSDQNAPQALQPSLAQQNTRKDLLKLFENSPIPNDQILENLELYMRPQRISEILALQDLYLKVLNVHGIIVEFGVRWGRHLSVFSALRAMHEPYNLYRKIVGFDTFTGFMNITAEDGASDRVHNGAMSVSPHYEEHLSEILALHEAEAPLSHIRRFELRKGDAPVELAKYLELYPETLIALAYFDMDIYAPTKACLEMIKPHLPKGSVVAFDELLHPDFPGETRALKAVLDITKHKIQRPTTTPYPCYIVL